MNSVLQKLLIITLAKTIITIAFGNLCLHLRNNGHVKSHSLRIFLVMRANKMPISVIIQTVLNERMISYSTEAMRCKPTLSWTIMEIRLSANKNLIVEIWIKRLEHLNIGVKPYSTIIIYCIQTDKVGSESPLAYTHCLIGKHIVSLCQFLGIPQHKLIIRKHTLPCLHQFLNMFWKRFT